MAWGRMEPPRRSVATVAVFAVVALLTVFAVAVPADAAITQAQAERVAKRSLGSLMRGGDARLFGLRAALPAGAVVTEGGIPQRRVRSARRRGDTIRARVRAPRLRRPAYMFWLDLAPGGGFQKPSVIVLVDRESGRVARRQSISWCPVVNGRRINTPDVAGRPRASRPTAWTAAIVPGLRND